jgi:MoaA/NifB/PqqE/SkfB family radical SAM enzyme
VSCVHGYPEIRKKYSLGVNCMPWDLYEKIVLEGGENNCPSISTHNNDEPLLIKDLEKRISFAKDHGFMDIIMTTNGVLFTEEKIKMQVLPVYFFL